MAISYSHRLGQIIGESLENAIEPFLKKFAREHKLYFDKKGHRPARSGTKLTWIDINQNKHDLDFVLERNGTKEQTGTPIAFIECAWRRYTKHSRNKAQEIQGAVIPLYEKYKKVNPFIGVILAGEFTENSLTQLKSLGFSILYFPYNKIVDAFSTEGIDVFFDEKTKETYFAKQVKAWNVLTEQQKEKVYKKIAKLNLSEIGQFTSKLESKLSREIVKVGLWTMFGKQYIFGTIEKAKEFIINTDVKNISPEFCQYIAEIEYSNGDTIKVSYHDQDEMLCFLSTFVS